MYAIRKMRIKPDLARKSYMARLCSVLILGAIIGLVGAAEGVTPNALLYAEDFEAPLTNNMPIGQVGGWQSGPLDNSKVNAESYSFDATTRPIVPSADLQVLHVDTQTDAATSLFDIPDADQILYMDTMLNLSPRSSIPASATNDPAVQLFFYLNADTNLVVYNGGMDGAAPMMTVIPGPLMASNEWNRFSVTMDFLNGDAGTVNRKYFKIQMNGADITTTQAYSAPGATGAFDGGAWFFTADQAGPDTIDSVSFEGYGKLDDFVMSTRAPLFTTDLVYYVTSELLGAGAVTPWGEVAVVEGSSTQIVYQADPWYEIADFQQNGAALPGAVGEQVYTTVYANVQADISNRVQFVESTASVDGKTPATWYGPLGADPTMNDEDFDGLSLYEEYLINSDPGIANTFAISAYNPGDPMASMSWESLGLPNGQVITEVSTNLVEGTWDPINGFLTHLDTTTTWHATESMPDENAAFLRVNVTE